MPRPLSAEQREPASAARSRRCQNRALFNSAAPFVRHRMASYRGDRCNDRYGTPLRHNRNVTLRRASYACDARPNTLLRSRGRAVGAALSAGVVVVAAVSPASDYLRTGNFPGELQRHAWFSVMTPCSMQALAPLWARDAAELARAGARRAAPRRELAHAGARASSGSRRSGSRPSARTASRPGRRRSARDVVGTLALCAGGVSAALLLPRARRCARWLAPGALA